LDADGRSPRRWNVVLVVSRRSFFAHSWVFAKIEVDIFEFAQMVFKSEEELFVALWTILISVTRSDAMSVVSSDISDFDIIGEFLDNVVAVNVDNSGLAGLKSVDWEIVALVRAGDVVVKVAEEWEGGVEESFIKRYEVQIKSLSSHKRIKVDDWESFHRTIRSIPFSCCLIFPIRANFWSEEPDDVVQVLVAETLESSPEVSVRIEFGLSWEWEG